MSCGNTENIRFQYGERDLLVTHLGKGRIFSKIDFPVTQVRFFPEFGSELLKIILPKWKRLITGHLDDHRLGKVECSKSGVFCKSTTFCHQ